MSRAIALLAGFGAGYMGEKKNQKERERQDKRDARDEEQYQEGKADRQALRDERNQALNDKNELRTAALPVAVSTTPGQAMPASEGAMASDNPTVGGYKAGANRFATEGMAQADAATQNTPEATRERYVATMRKQGNFQGADEMATRGIQVEAAQSTLKENKELSAGRAGARQVADTLARTGYQGLAKLMTEKYDDGNTYTAVEDGKGGAKFTAVTKDGKPVGSMDFANHADAIMAAVGKTNPEKWVDYQTGRDDKKQAQSNSDRTYELAKQSQLDKKELDAAKLDLATQRAALSRATAGAKAAPGEAPTWNKDADKQLIELFTSKDPETGKMVYDGHGAQFAQRIAIDAASKNGGNTMAAVARAADIDNALKIKANGDPALLRDLRNKALQDASQPAAAPQAAPAPAAARAQAGITPPPQAAPVAPAQPAAPPPTMQQTQEFFRAKQAQVAEATQKFNADPRIPALMQKKNDAIRRGKSVEANSYLAEVQAIKQGYGL